MTSTRVTGRGRAAEDTVVFGLLLPVGLYLFTVLGFVSHYSYRPVEFSAQYTHGVYRFRFLARDAITWVAGALGHLAGPGLSPSQALFGAFVLVGCVSVATLGLSLYRATVLPFPDAFGPYVVLVVVMVLSTYSVTPYDLPSYALIALTCLVGVGPRPGPRVVAAALAAAAMCTRESAFLAAAACVAWCWAHDRPGGRAGVLSRLRGAGLEAARWRNAVTVSGATVVTYAAVHVALGTSGPWGLWAGPGVGANLRDPGAVTGVVLAAAGSAFVWHGYARLGLPPAAARARRALWVLAVPYLAVSAVGGIWFESPRLIAPVLLCEYLVVLGGREARPEPVRPSGSASQEAVAPAGR